MICSWCRVKLDGPERWFHDSDCPVGLEEMEMEDDG